LWTTLESSFNPPQVGCLQARLASGPSGFLKRPSSTPGKLRRPATHRLPMHPDAPGHFCLRNSLPEKLGGEEAPLFQLLEVSPYSFLVSHALNIAQGTQCVTILFNAQ
jgi:hypothetical protein